MAEKIPKDNSKINESILQVSLEGLKIAQRSQENEIQTLKDKMADMKAAYEAKLVEKNQDYEIMRVELERHITTADERVERLEEELRRQRQVIEINGVEHTMSDLQQAIDRQKAELKKNIEDLDKELADQYELEDILKREIEGLRTEINRFQVRLSDQRKETWNWRKKFDDKVKDNEKLVKTNKYLEELHVKIVDRHKKEAYQGLLAKNRALSRNIEGLEAAINKENPRRVDFQAVATAVSQEGPNEVQLMFNGMTGKYFTVTRVGLQHTKGYPFIHQTEVMTGLLAGEFEFYVFTFKRLEMSKNEDSGEWGPTDIADWNLDKDSVITLLPTHMRSNENTSFKLVVNNLEERPSDPVVRANQKLMINETQKNTYGSPQYLWSLDDRQKYETAVKDKTQWPPNVSVEPLEDTLLRELRAKWAKEAAERLTPDAEVGYVLVPQKDLNNEDVIQVEVDRKVVAMAMFANRAGHPVCFGCLSRHPTIMTCDESKYIHEKYKLIPEMSLRNNAIKKYGKDVKELVVDVETRKGSKGTITLTAPLPLKERGEPINPQPKKRTPLNEVEAVLNRPKERQTVDFNPEVEVIRMDDPISGQNENKSKNNDFIPLNDNTDVEDSEVESMDIEEDVVEEQKDEEVSDVDDNKPHPLPEDDSKESTDSKDDSINDSILKDFAQEIEALELEAESQDIEMASETDSDVSDYEVDPTIIGGGLTEYQWVDIIKCVRKMLDAVALIEEEDVVPPPGVFWYEEGDRQVLDPNPYAEQLVSEVEVGLEDVHQETDGSDGGGLESGTDPRRESDRSVVTIEESTDNTSDEDILLSVDEETEDNDTDDETIAGDEDSDD